MKENKGARSTKKPGVKDLEIVSKENSYRKIMEGVSVEKAKGK